MKSASGFLVAVTAFTALVLGITTACVSTGGCRKNLVDEYDKEFVNNAITNCWEALAIIQGKTDNALSEDDGSESETITDIKNWLIKLEGVLEEQETGLKQAVEDGTAEVLIETVRNMNEAKVQTEDELEEMNKNLDANPGPLVNNVRPLLNASVTICLTYADVVADLLLGIAEAANSCC